MIVFMVIFIHDNTNKVVVKSIKESNSENMLFLSSGEWISHEAEWFHNNYEKGTFNFEVELGSYSFSNKHKTTVSR